MQVLCLYGPGESKPRVKSELRKQQYTVTLFDCTHLAHVIVLWQMQKCTVFALFYFGLIESNFRVEAPGGNSSEVLLHYEFGGLIFREVYTWRSLFF